MAALGLMLTCMYTGKEKISPGRVADQNQAAPDSESVIVAMERVSVLFDRVRKGFPFEARVVTRILPQFLDDFFPPQDVMNKVIGEFLSNQQPYPQFMATVVYKVRFLKLYFFHMSPPDLFCLLTSNTLLVFRFSLLLRHFH
nr:huntingtin-like [Zootoca vivipara]